MAKQIPIQPPIKGINEVDPFTEYDPNHATDALNVRPFEQGQGRQAIGQRAGTGKWASLPVGDNPIRVIKQMNLPLRGFSALWTDPFGSQPDGSYHATTGTGDKADYDASDAGLVGYTYNISSNRATSNSGGGGSLFFKTDADSIILTFHLLTGNMGASLSDVFIDFGDNTYVDGATYRFREILINHNGAEVTFFKADGTNEMFNEAAPPGGWATGGGVALDFTIIITPTAITITVAGHGSRTFNTPAGYDYNNLESLENLLFFRWNAGFVTTKAFLSGFTLQTDQTSTAPSLLLVEGSNIVQWSLGAGYQTPTGGSNAINATGEVALQQAFGKVYIVDADHFLVYDPVAVTIDDAVATAGTLPTGYQFATLFQGRLFLFMNTDDPGNWFASKLGDPLNFDTATGLSTSAVVGNNSVAGALAEPMTAAVPWADNWLIMAGANELHVLRGSPKTGTRDLITNQIGIVGPRAWCQLPNGSIVFCSQHGLYSLAPGGQPQALSHSRIRTFFNTIDFSTTSVELAWSLPEQCVYVAVKPNDTTLPVDVLVWNVRNDSFWQDSYPINQGPNAMGLVSFRNDRLLLLGGRDSYLRVIDRGTYSDDGIAITSRVRFAPIILADGNSLGRITKARMNWGSGISNSNFGCQYRYHVGDTAPQAAASTSPVHSRDVMLGTYQSLDRERARAGAISLEIISKSKPNGNFTTWSFETGVLEVTPAGRIRTTVGPDADLGAYGVPEGGIGGFEL